MLNRTLFFIALFLISINSLGQFSSEFTQSLDDNWQFYFGDVENAFANDFSSSNWKTVDIPHDASVEAGYSADNNPQNGYLPSGIGWYRKKIEIRKEWLDKNVLIYFAGVYMNSTVWLNGIKVGGRPYGFISFYCDISSAIREGDNIIEVKVDNTPGPTARFYHGTSIYGHVELKILSAIHINPLGGIYVQTEEVKNGIAKLSITTEVLNSLKKDKKVTVQHKILDADNHVVAHSNQVANVFSNDTSILNEMLMVNEPNLWSVEDPFLYTIETTITQKNKVLDIVKTQFGVRTFRFDAQTGFWLNNTNLKLKGVCEHQEMMPVGLAVTDEMWRWRIETLKSMGVNAIRTSHNPYPPVFYKLCDSYGVLVMDEIFDGWHKKGANDYGGRFLKEWWKKDVEDWIRRDRNHACVILWSIGNETGKSDKNNITEFIHQFDPRPTTGGTVFHGVDVTGFNGPAGQPGVLEKFKEQHPDNPVVLTEVPHTLHTRGFYRTATWFRDIGDPRIHEFEPYNDTQIFFDGHERYKSSYDNCQVRINARTSWKRTKRTPWISGEFRWTGFDCFGESQFMGGIPFKRSYNAGVIDLAGFPKDAYYLYQSFWIKEPMVHILPHWTHPNLNPGIEIPVVAYSNCDEVELFLNGKSLGRKKPGELFDFVWQVPYTPGEIKAIAYNGEEAVAEKKYRTAAYPVEIKLAKSEGAFEIGKKDFVYVNLHTVDNAGEMVPWVQNRIHFDIEGPARFLGLENGNPIDSTHNKAKFRNMFNGLLKAYFESTPGKGDVVVTTAGILGDTLFQESTHVSIDIGQIVIRGDFEKVDMEIRYTTNGQKPGEKSQLYEAPFQIVNSTAIQAIVYRDGMEIFHLVEKFNKGDEPEIIDERWSQSDMEQGYPKDFPRTLDKEIIGKWKETGIIFEFKKDGILYKHILGKATPVAYWWYNYPNDIFEAGEDAGNGQLMWMNSNRISELKLANLKADQLQIMTGQSSRLFSR